MPGSFPCSYSFAVGAMEGQLWPFHIRPASLSHALLMLNFHILSKHEFMNEYDNFKQKQVSCWFPDSWLKDISCHKTSHVLWKPQALGFSSQTRRNDLTLNWFSNNFRTNREGKRHTFRDTSRQILLKWKHKIEHKEQKPIVQESSKQRHLKHFSLQIIFKCKLGNYLNGEDCTSEIRIHNGSY